MANTPSRPDPSSPRSVAHAEFNTGRRGYRIDEVRGFLIAVGAELDRLQERIRQLEASLNSRPPTVSPDELDDDVLARVLGDETVRVLQTARESAEEIRQRAEEDASRLMAEATAAADTARQEADADVARQRQEAEESASAQIEAAKEQGREMVDEARAYRERVLADLQRRTSLARDQIESLIHGRDRLLEVFERSRLVAVDVTSGLKEIDLPDEYVNLAATTGPVPVMVPSAPRPADSRPTTLADLVEATADIDDRAGTEDGDEIVVKVDDESGDPAGTDDSDDDESGAENVEDTAEVADSEDVDEGVDSDLDDGEVSAEDAAGDEDADTGDDLSNDESPANVVTLFPATSDGETPEPHLGVVADADDDDADDNDDDEDDDEGGAEPSGDTGGDVASSSDVKGLFARLRDGMSQADDPGDVGDEVGDEELAGDPIDAEESNDDPVDGSGASAFVQRDEALTTLMTTAARQLKRVMADEQNDLLDALRRGDSDADDLVPSAEEYAAPYLDVLAESLSDAAVSGAAVVDDSVRQPADDVLEGARALAVSHLVEPLRQRLAAVIAEASGDADEIVRAVRMVYREWKLHHIDAELDSVLCSAFGHGLGAAIPAGTPVVWAVDPSAVACPECEDNSLASGVVAGDEFPTGHRAAPAHPGCRCLTLPVGS
ncbi:MAG: hypothetical protein CSA55_04010 [Ilumatobacter coccineus]|uniref:Antigen 84 n=1 Tax=Ilumatobacter coccineus TaxID=467094 RepID=A0A2G6K8V1_9ACTN|nr:MAG: hypothetical protein CSA55_04010 [Ilumatobacter coccineus]